MAFWAALAVDEPTLLASQMSEGLQPRFVLRLDHLAMLDAFGFEESPNADSSVLLSDAQRAPLIARLPNAVVTLVARALASAPSLKPTSAPPRLRNERKHAKRERRKR